VKNKIAEAILLLKEPRGEMRFHDDEVAKRVAKECKQNYIKRDMRCMSGMSSSVINHNYYNFLESDWLRDCPILALIGQL